MIHVLDYGLGNVQAFLSMYKKLRIDAIRARRPDDLIGAKKIILPGVGAFDYAMESLNKSGMRSVLELLVKDENVSLLGVCVGMQILATSSEEGNLSGLNFIPGIIKEFKQTMGTEKFPLPHMGWNKVSPKIMHPLFAGLEENAYFYFLHSYYFKTENPQNGLAGSFYGYNFDSAVCLGNIYGVQFHPEKSHNFGASLLKNFADL